MKKYSNSERRRLSMDQNTAIEIEQENERQAFEFPKPEFTPFGFPVIRFLDRYDKPCYVEMSTLADCAIPGASALMIGMEGQPEFVHLHRTQVEKLIPILQRWIDTGTVEDSGTAG